MKRVLQALCILAVLALPARALAAGFPNPTPVGINITSATTTQLVAGVAGLQIYGWSLVLNGTVAASTFQLEYGTGTTCGTGTTTLGGAWTFTADGFVAPNWQVPLIIPPGNSLCAVTTGTSPVFTGLLIATQS
jgi:hypothetical protein